MTTITTVDGLVSGLDTTSVIKQLMAVERAPVQKLQDRQTTFNTRASAWGEIASKISALRSAVDGLTAINGLKLFKVTASDSSLLTASAGAGASVGPVTLQIESLAAAHQQVSSGFASTNTVVGEGTATITAGLAGVGATAFTASSGLASGAHTLTVSESATVPGTFEASLDGGTPVPITSNSSITIPAVDPVVTVDFGAEIKAGTVKASVARTSAGATLSDLAAAISAAGGPAGAQAIDLGSGVDPARLIISGSDTGTAHALTTTLSGFAGFGAGLTDLRAAADAKIHLGTLVATRSSNTINDLLPGVTLNLAKAAPGTDVTVNVASDGDGVVAKVKSLVDALNGLTTTVQKHTAYDATTKKGGALSGDASARSLTSSLFTASGGALPTGTYTLLSQLGVSTTSKGGYTFDETKLRTALSSDAAATETALAALAAPISAWVKDWDATTGASSRAQASAQAQSASLQTQIDAYNVRLATREAVLQRQFTSLETALGQLRNQGNWLSGQLARL